MPKFATKAGWLTGYAHACGYLDTASKDGDGRFLTMGVDGCYFVRARTRPAVWECFDGPKARSEARAFFKQLCRTTGARRKPNTEPTP